MHRHILAAISSVALLSCASTRPTPLPERVALPVRAQPPFHLASYTSLTKNMLVHLDTAQLKAKVKSEFPELNSSRASLALIEEHLVLSNGSPFRRVWFSYGDEATNTMHGPCNQNIYVWVSPTGEIDKIYTDPMSCPI